MPNERLRATLLERGITPSALGEELGVDHKTVERWISGRVPYRRHRYAVASRLGVDEAYLWPGALSLEQVTAASDSEVLAIYAHRSDVPHDVWVQLFTSAERDIGVLVYSIGKHEPSLRQPTVSMGSAGMSPAVNSSHLARAGQEKSS